MQKNVYGLEQVKAILLWLPLRLFKGTGFRIDIIIIILIGSMHVMASFT